MHEEGPRPPCVISGFPGVGKSSLIGAGDIIAVDYDFPGLDLDEYINRINRAVANGWLVLVPSWLTLREAMQHANIPYAVCYPIPHDDSVKLHYKSRYEARGSSIDFIDGMMKNWDTFLQSMVDDPSPNHIQLHQNDTLLDCIVQHPTWSKIYGLQSSQK